jgi:hypothetical protein
MAYITQMPQPWTRGKTGLAGTRDGGQREDRAVGPMAESTGAERPREWLALPGGGIRPVVSVAGTSGTAELVAYAVWLARLRPTCQCGRPRLGSGRTCGDAACVALLRAQETGNASS